MKSYIAKEYQSLIFVNKNDGYILVRGDITIIGHNLIEVAFKNCASFKKYMTKIDGTTINDAADLGLLLLRLTLRLARSC